MPLNICPKCRRIACICGIAVLGTWAVLAPTTSDESPPSQTAAIVAQISGATGRAIERSGVAAGLWFAALTIIAHQADHGPLCPGGDQFGPPGRHHRAVATYADHIDFRGVRLPPPVSSRACNRSALKAGPEMVAGGDRWPGLVVGALRCIRPLVPFQRRPTLVIGSALGCQTGRHSHRSVRR